MSTDQKTSSFCHAVQVVSLIMIERISKKKTFPHMNSIIFFSSTNIKSVTDKAVMPNWWESKLELGR